MLKNYNISNKNRPLKIGFVALGCPKNIVDAEKMLGLLAAAGFVIDYDIAKADIILINSCGFIAPAIAETKAVISEAIGYKMSKKSPVAKVIVAGCTAQRLGKELLTEFPALDAVVALGRRDDIVKIVSGLYANHTRQTAEFYPSPAGWDSISSNDTGRLLITPQHSAFLRISEGCDRNCSYCTIPSIKGHFRSKPLDMLLAEARQLVASGAVELSLIAQDSTNWGSDLGLKNGLSSVIKALEEIDELKWLRLMYLNPPGITDELIETIGSSKKVVNYFDMPIQHINNDILKAMHRTDSHEKLAALIKKIRTAVPDAVLRTTVIAGFSSETASQFNELLDFIKETKFDALGCFAFEPEDGTAAAALPGRLTDKVKTARRDKIMLAQQKIVFEKNKAAVDCGKVFEVLIDGFDAEGRLFGRHFGQAPDIDSVCLISGRPVPAGSLIRAKTVSWQDYDLIVKV